MARAQGRSPREVASDPELPYNATVMRAAQRAREMRWGMAMAGCKNFESQVLTALRLLYEG